MKRINRGILTTTEDVREYQRIYNEALTRFLRLGLTDKEAKCRAADYLALHNGTVAIVRHEFHLTPLIAGDAPAQKPRKPRKVAKKRKPKSDSSQLDLFEDDPIGH